MEQGLRARPTHRELHRRTRPRTRSSPGTLRRAGFDGPHKDAPEDRPSLPRGARPAASGPPGDSRLDRARRIRDRGWCGGCALTSRVPPDIETRRHRQEDTFRALPQRSGTRRSQALLPRRAAHNLKGSRQALPQASAPFRRAP